VRIDKLRTEFELDCRYHPFPLHPETPDVGRSLEELFGGRMDIPAAMAQLRKVADSLALPFGDRNHTYNSRLAQELGLWAAEQGEFAVYEQAVYRAYFVDGVNLAEPDQLIRFCAALSLDEAEAARILQEKTYAVALDAIWDRALASGIRAVPTLRCEGRELVGFQSMDACRQLITG